MKRDKILVSDIQHFFNNNPLKKTKAKNTRKRGKFTETMLIIKK